MKQTTTHLFIAVLMAILDARASAVEIVGVAGQRI